MIGLRKKPVNSRVFYKYFVLNFELSFISFELLVKYLSMLWFKQYNKLTIKQLVRFILLFRKKEIGFTRHKKLG